MTAHPAPEPVSEREGLATALHDHIDGDFLLVGGGWGPDGWVGDIPHDKARVSDLVRWAVNAIEASDWLAARDRAAEARALREAADYAEHGPVPQRSNQIAGWLRDRAARIEEQPS